MTDQLSQHPRPSIRVRSIIVMLCGLFCLLAVGRFIWLAVGPGAWGPRFACTEIYFDCGVVSPEKNVKHEFIIRNTGREPLRILKAIPSCGSCLKLELPKNEIPPGGSSILIVMLETKNLNKGKFRKNLLLITNDPAVPKAVLFMIGTTT